MKGRPRVRLRPDQLIMPGLCTTDTVALVYQRAVKSAEKESEKKRAERLFDLQLRGTKMPAYKSELTNGPQARVESTHLTPKLGQKAFWRVDFLFLDYPIIVEINGGIWMAGTKDEQGNIRRGGAHSHPIDIERNQRKMNDLMLRGYKVLQFTPKEVKQGEALAFTMRVLETIGWTR